MLVNLTMHEVVIYRESGGKIILPPDGCVARAEQSSAVAAHVHGVPVVEMRFGAVSGLPEPKAGVFYVVSAITAQAAPDRDDLLMVADPVRDDGGRIIGCRAFSRTPRKGV